MKELIAFLVGGGALWIASRIISARRHNSQLGRMAYRDWMARCNAIAEKHSLDIYNVEFGASCDRLWQSRWRGRLTPDQAVQQEIDMRQLAQTRR